MKWDLVSFVTSDKIQLNGIMHLPARVRGVVVFVHGFTSSFTSKYVFFDLLTKKLERAGWGVLAFNNRGHGVINRFYKIDPDKDKGYSSVTIGGIYEKFEDCIFDIRGAVEFVHSKIMCDIILCGSSTGANKVAYFAGHSKIRNFKGMVLMGAVSDIEAFKNDLGDRYDMIIGRAKGLIKEGRGGTLIDLGPDNFISAARLVSMTTLGGLEEVFSYTDPQAKFTTLAKIKVPIFALFGENDEHMKADKEKVLDLYKKYAGTKNFKGIIIRRAYHSFSGFEKETTGLIKNWIVSLRI